MKVVNSSRFRSSLWTLSKQMSLVFSGRRVKFCLFRCFYINIIPWEKTTTLLCKVSFLDYLGFTTMKGWCEWLEPHVMIDKKWISFECLAATEEGDRLQSPFSFLPNSGDIICSIRIDWAIAFGKLEEGDLCHLCLFPPSIWPVLGNGSGVMSIRLPLFNPSEC